MPTLEVVTGRFEGSVGADPRAERRRVAGSTALSLALRVALGGIDGTPTNNHSNHGQPQLND